jgi:hypothetical protein
MSPWDWLRRPAPSCSAWPWWSCAGASPCMWSVRPRYRSPGLVQMVLVGIVLALLLHGSLLVGVLILLLMTVAAALTAARRARGIEGAVQLSFLAIAAGSGVVIAAMLATGTLQTSVTMLCRWVA